MPAPNQSNGTTVVPSSEAPPPASTAIASRGTAPTGSPDDRHATILAFLAEKLTLRELRLCTQIDLARTEPNYREEPVKSWERPAHLDLFGDAALWGKLAHEVIAAAEQHVDEMNFAPQKGGIRFTIRCHEYAGNRTPKTFFVHPRSDERRNPDEQDATATGVLAMQMRHNDRMISHVERIFQSSLGVVADGAERMGKELDLARARIAALEAEIREHDDKSETRMFDAMIRERADGRKDKIIEKILPYVPVAAAALLGSGEAGSGGPVSPISIAANDLFSSITDAQKGQLARIFTMPQLMLLKQIADLAAAGKATPGTETVKAPA